jgi:ribosomal protein L21E
VMFVQQKQLMITVNLKITPSYQKQKCEHIFAGSYVKLCGAQRSVLYVYLNHKMQPKMCVKDFKLLSTFEFVEVIITETNL